VAEVGLPLAWWCLEIAALGIKVALNKLFHVLPWLATGFGLRVPPRTLTLELTYRPPGQCLAEGAETGTDSRAWDT
jgi:hypothetical protein